MTSAATKAIIFKDFNYIKRLFFVYLGFGLAVLSLNAIANKTSIVVISFFILTIFTAFYCHLAMKTTIFELKDKQWHFLITLPLSSRFLFLSKFLFSWVVFLLMWSVYLAGLALTILPSSHIPSMVFSLYILIFSLYPAAYALILSTGLLMRTEGSVILALVFCNSLSTAIVGLMSNNAEVQNGFPKGTFLEIGWIWPSWAPTLVLVSLAITLTTFIATALVGWNRKHYL